VQIDHFQVSLQIGFEKYLPLSHRLGIAFMSSLNCDAEPSCSLAPLILLMYFLWGNHYMHLSCL